MSDDPKVEQLISGPPHTHCHYCHVRKQQAAVPEPEMLEWMA